MDFQRYRHVRPNQTGKMGNNFLGDLAGAWFVSEQEAQWLTRQHGLLDGRDLVREGVDHRGVHRQHRVKQMCKPDALGF